MGFFTHLDSNLKKNLIRKTQTKKKENGCESFFQEAWVLIFHGNNETIATTCYVFFSFFFF